MSKSYVLLTRPEAAGSDSGAGGAPTTNPVGRLLIASLAGTTIEFFDFYIYATAAVLVFPKLFFPNADPTTAKLQSLATFALAFLARPIGSAVFGHFGDRIGRKATLVAALLTMGVSTVGIGLLPTYAVLGIWAPALLAVLRFGQGFGLGGEWGGAVLLATENAPPGKAAIYGMFPQLGAPLGFLCSTGAFLALDAALSDQQLFSWGWRLPFIASAVLVLVGLYVRLSLTETPAFRRAIENHERVRVPIVHLLSRHSPAVLLGMFAATATFVIFYLMTVFTLSWGTQKLGFTRPHFLVLQIIGVLFFAALIPLSAYLAQRFGTARILMLASAAIAVFGLSTAPLFGSGTNTGTLSYLCLGLALMGMTYGPLGTALSELFPTEVRYTGASLSFNLAGIVGASLAPNIATWLATSFGLAWVGYYLSVAGLVSLAAALAISAAGSAAAAREVVIRSRRMKHPLRPILPALLATSAAALLWATAAGAASKPAVEAAHGMVVSAQHLASDIGVDILRHGGNAVDAAVAVGYAEAVTNPCCGNIGGGGFMVIHLAKSSTNVFLNFRETAPAAATANMYLDANGNPVRGASIDGYRAVAVPGTVLGLDTALKRYGTLSRTQVMAPAIKLARDGFILTRGDTDIIDAGARRFRSDPQAAGVFLHPDGSTYQPGERLVQPELARTLEAIARGGSDAFYKTGTRGGNAEHLAQAMRDHGGIITAQDLASYTVTETEPVYCNYRGYQIASAPPPSSGGTTLCELLQILEGYDLKGMGFHSAAAVHVMTEAMRHAYVDRNSLLGDPAFVHNPVEKLLTPEYAALIRAQIDPQRAGSSAVIKPGTAPHEKPETTHYSVADEHGNAVSVTYTINGLFGAAVMAPGTGYLLNDEMDDFTVKPGVPNLFGLVQGTANAIAPGKRPLSSMSPTLVLRNGRVAMVLGSPGGSRIITITLEVLLNLIDYGMGPQEAVNATRLHHQWAPDVVFAEPFALSADTAQILQTRGYTLAEQSPWGAAELIVIPQTSSGPDRASSGNDSALGGRLRAGMIYGASDDRRAAGSAAGY